MNNINYTEHLINLLNNEKIQVCQDPKDDSAKCFIGDYWFYFLHIEDNTCLEDFTADELAIMINDILLDPISNGLSQDEADYYIAVINELTIPQEEMTFEENLDLEFSLI